jgi:hypothetical protein
LFGDLAGQGLGQADDPGLRRAVVAQLDAPDLAELGGHVDDDPAPAGEHLRQGLLRAQEGPPQVDGDHAIEVLGGELHEGLLL